MQIFVAGGTGVLGRSVLGLLNTAGHRVHATARGPAKAGTRAYDLVAWRLS